MDRVFVTGATGFVGRALIERLLDDGVDVLAGVRRHSGGFSSDVRQLELGELADLNDPGSVVQHALPEMLNGVDVLVHTAARVHVMRDTMADPLAEFRLLNRDVTLVLARAAAAAGVRRFVYLSSIKVNGERTYPPHPSPRPPEAFLRFPDGAREMFREDDVPGPQDAYAISKFEAEQGLFEIARETGLEVVIIRPPLVYGPGVKGNFASMMRWVEKGVPLPFGAVHENRRSLVALDNLVDFIVCCAKHPKASNEVFLISDGEDISTSELLRKLAVVCGVKPHLLPVPVGLMRFAAGLLGKAAVADRLFGSLQVDSSKARELLGWRPVVTMEEGFGLMVRGEG